MNLKLREKEIEFNFTGVLEGFKFDEENPQSPYYHGLTHCNMKQVDFVVEFKKYYLFIEVKDYNTGGRKDEPDSYDELIDDLVGKFRDTFIYRWAEEKIDKPIKYLCLLNLSKNPPMDIQNKLRRQVPEGIPRGVPEGRWKRPLASSCMVFDIDTWNRNFPNWLVERV